MIRIGVINIDVSHPKRFSEILLEGDRARYVAVYNDGFRPREEVEAFVHNSKLEKICDSVEELADSVDIGFIQGCNWDKHLDYVQPFIDRNKPVFIDKPAVGNVADINKLLELEKNGAKILGSSSLRYSYEVREFLEKPEAERGKVLNVSITVGTDEFNYAIHAVEGLCAMIDAKPVSTRFIGTAHQDGKKCETYFVTFENGATGQYHCVEGRGCPFHVVAVTTKQDSTFTVNPGKLYIAMLDQICNNLEGKENCMADMTTVTDAIRVMLAGKASKENEGKEIAIYGKEVEATSFDGYAFEKEYAAAASPLYVIA